MAYAGWTAPINLSKIRDWQRVGIGWRRVCGGHGLSVHAMATLVNRPPEVILREMLKPGSAADLFHCEETNAYLWAVDTVYAGEGLRLGNSGYRRNEERFSVYLADVRAQIKTYPWPEFKGIRRMRGTPKLSGVGRNAADLRRFAAEPAYLRDRLNRCSYPTVRYNTDLILAVA